MAAGKLTHNEAGNLDLGALDILGVCAGVPDEWERLDQDLARVRGIGERLLIPTHGGVEDDFGFADEALARGAEGDAVEDGAVCEGEPSNRRVRGRHLSRLMGQRCWGCWVGGWSRVGTLGRAGHRKRSYRKKARSHLASGDFGRVSLP
jgi:hypothetical protein